MRYGISTTELKKSRTLASYVGISSNVDPKSRHIGTPGNLIASHVKRSLNKNDWIGVLEDCIPILFNTFLSQYLTTCIIMTSWYKWLYIYIKGLKDFNYVRKLTYYWFWLSFFSSSNTKQCKYILIQFHKYRLPFQFRRMNTVV